MTIDILSYLDSEDLENLELNNLTHRFLIQVDEVIILNLQDKTIINQWLVNRITYLSSWHPALEVKPLIDSQSEISLQTIYNLIEFSNQDQVQLYYWLFLYYSLLIRYYGFNKSKYDWDILHLNDSNSLIIEDGTSYYNKTYLPKFIQVLIYPDTEMDMVYFDYINNIKNEIKFSTNPKSYITSKIYELISYVDIHSIKDLLDKNKEDIYVDGDKIIDDDGTFASEFYMYIETDQENKFIHFDNLVNFDKRDLFLEAYEYLQSLHIDLFSKKYVTNIDWLDNMKIDDISKVEKTFEEKKEKVTERDYYLLFAWLYHKENLIKPPTNTATNFLTEYQENITKYFKSRTKLKNPINSTLKNYIQAGSYPLKKHALHRTNIYTIFFKKLGYDKSKQKDIPNTVILKQDGLDFLCEKVFKDKVNDENLFKSLFKLNEDVQINPTIQEQLHSIFHDFPD